MEKVLSKRRSREAHESLKRFLDAHGLAQHNPCQELGVWCSTEPRPVILFDKGYYIGRDQSDSYLSLLLLAKVEWLALLSKKNIFVQLSGVNGNQSLCHLAFAE